MKGVLDISQPGGQQILYNFVNWKLSGHEPIPPIGGVEHYNSRPSLFKVVSLDAFRSAAKKIAPVACGKMSQEDFDTLLRSLGHLQNKKKLQAEMKKHRRENPCNGSNINAPFPIKVDESMINTSIDLLNRYTAAGRRLLMDFVDCDKTGFDPTFKVGNAKHWRSRPEYQQVSRYAFRSQAVKIAKDVRYHVPNAEEMEKIFDEVLKEIANREKQKKKLHSSDN